MSGWIGKMSTEYAWLTNWLDLNLDLVNAGDLV